MSTCYLRIGDDPVEKAKFCRSVKSACERYMSVAEGLARYEQQIEASIHIAPDRNKVVEYPDFVLSLGPRGGLKKEAA